jgi:ABC-2 type transport system ATP-binding protein
LMAGASFYDHLTALQNLEFFARLGGRTQLRSDDLAMALREVGLPEAVFSQRVKRLNPGMRQKLGFAAALLKDAPTLLLDEPTAGLDPQATAELIELIQVFRDRGKAILLATQDLFQAKQLADSVGILKEGRKVLAFSREELRQQDLEVLYLNYMRGSLGPGHSSLGARHESRGSGHASPGHESPGHASPGHASPGHASPG